MKVENTVSGGGPVMSPATDFILCWIYYSSAFRFCNSASSCKLLSIAVAEALRACTFTRYVEIAVSLDSSITQRPMKLSYGQEEV